MTLVLDDNDGDESVEGQELLDNSVKPTGINDTLRLSLEAHVASWQSMRGFTNNEVNAIKLLHTLRQSKAPLGMYKSVMHWHFEAKGSI